MREIKHLSVHQWLRSAIPDSQQPSSPIGFLFLKLPSPPCAVLLVYMYYKLNSKTYYSAFYFFFIICYMSQYYIISYRIILNYTRLYIIRIYQIRLFCVVLFCVLFYQFMVCVLYFYISVVLCIEKMYIICYDHYTYHMRHGTWVYTCASGPCSKLVTFLYKSVSFFPAALVVPLTHGFQWTNWVIFILCIRI